jgi:hypothetical protein
MSETTETDLFTDTIDANTFITDGDEVSAEYSIDIAGSVTSTQRIRAYVGGTVVYDSTALTFGATASSLQLYVSAMRSASGSLRCSTLIDSDNTILTARAKNSTVSGLTFSSGIVIKITAQAGSAGAASNQAIGRKSSTLLLPAA